MGTYLKNLDGHTVWKNEKFTLTEKLFREISSLAIGLVQALLSQHFC